MLLLGAWTSGGKTAAASNEVVINFDEVPAQGGNPAGLTTEYAGLGVTFASIDDAVIRAGISGGDPGAWGLEGPNGPQFLSFNGTSYSATISFAQNATAVSLKAARSNGSSGGDSVTLTASCGGGIVATDTLVFGAINEWGTLSVAAPCIDSVLVQGAGSGFHPFGVDDLHVTVEDSGVTSVDINFDEVPAQGGNSGGLTTEYAGLGVTFASADDAVVRPGISGGDPGAWGLEGPNGPQFLSFNGTSYSTTISFVQNATSVSLKAARSNGSSPGDSVTLTAYCAGAVVATDTLVFGAINEWGSLSVAAPCIDSVLVAGAGSGFHPYGVDDLRIVLQDTGVSSVGINFDEVPAQGGNPAGLTTEYAGLGVTFASIDDAVIRAGISGGDPGAWGLEGPNGPQFLSFNGTSYSATISFAQNATAVSLKAARSNGSSGGDSVTLTASCKGGIVATDTLVFGGINEWGTLSVAAPCIDSVLVQGAGSGFHPYGVDDLRILVQGAEDAEAPTLEATVSPAANAAGWHNGDVTVTWVCTDEDSGVDEDESDLSEDILTESGAAEATCVDLAGNSTTESVEIQIDSVAPVLTHTVIPTPNEEGWNSTGATVTWACTDEGSGVDEDESNLSDDVLTEDGTAEATCVDLAGNVTTGSIDVLIDQVAPVLTGTASPAPNAAGWNNSDVTVTWSCTDDGSGVDEDASDLGQDVLAASGSAQATCADLAGNVTEQSVDVLIDKDAPVVTVLGVAQGATYTLGFDVPEASCSTVDALSGVAVQATLTLAGGPTGLVTATCGGATDIAGNLAPPVSVTYTVQSPADSLEDAIEDILGDEGIAGSFLAQAQSISAAPNPKAKAGKLNAFIKHVNAQVGKTLTAEEAALLIALAQLI